MKVLSVLLLVVIAVVCCLAQPPQIATDDQNQNDYLTLNYALTLEHLEAAFYREGLARFSAADFQAAGYDSSVRPYISLIGAHEDAHVTLLVNVLEQNGVPAVRACTYNFNASLSSVRNFLSTAQLLEVTGTQAYDGAANTINNANYLQVAASIATVEARHSAYLNQLNNRTAFPLAFEEALTPEQVVAAAGSFFVSCPDGDVQYPVFAYTYVTLDSNGTYFNRSGQLENSEQIQNDDDLLNYALTLELFGQSFYNRARNFSLAQFQAAGFGNLYNYFQMIIDHENAHVNFLSSVLTSRGATPAQPCTYNYGAALDSVANALNFARTLENLEVTAYVGAINTITDYQLIQGAATIATVEARHAQFLNQALLNISVNNASLDDANVPAAILNITAPFFGADCVAPQQPVQAFTLQFLNAQAAAATPTPSPSTGATPSPSPVPSTPAPTPSATVAPSVTPTPTATPTTCTVSPSPSSSCGCNGNNGNDEGNVVINFYFADILRGL
eukprot:TRINITY_DN167_c0_g1_i2.p1 TRINITY_DN167_c0_g1~~TRINITY_DN167_c0_g1_i2.p1  ORF type:complete len:503 (-),score=135.62 TRINITY_DN167_c0_g1_i2:22-1530(-)